MGQAGRCPPAMLFSMASQRRYGQRRGYRRRPYYRGALRDSPYAVDRAKGCFLDLVLWAFVILAGLYWGAYGLLWVGRWLSERLGSG